MSTEQFECDCGFTWLKGHSGSHGCEEGYRKQIADLRAALALAQAPSAPVAPTWRLVDIEGAIRRSMQDNQFAVQGDSQFVSVMAKSLMPYFERAALSVKADPTESVQALRDIIPFAERYAERYTSNVYSYPFMARARAAAGLEAPLGRTVLAKVVATAQSADDVVGELVEGMFYWVWIALDPDAEHHWENDYMPARFNGYEKDGSETWNFLSADCKEWPARAVYHLDPAPATTGKA